MDTYTYDEQPKWWRVRKKLLLLDNGAHDSGDTGAVRVPVQRERCSERPPQQTSGGEGAQDKLKVRMRELPARKQKRKVSRKPPNPKADWVTAPEQAMEWGHTQGGSQKSLKPSRNPNVSLRGRKRIAKGRKMHGQTSGRQSRIREERGLWSG